MGIGDWGLGIGDWGFGGLGQNPKTPIPNPQSPGILNHFKFIFSKLKYNISKVSINKIKLIK